MTKRRFSSLLPAVNQTEALIRFFGATVDQVFQTGTSQQISGYVGQHPPYTDPARDFYVSEPTAERQAYQLEPSMVSITPEGVLTHALAYPDLLSYLETSGGVVTNQSRLFETDYYSWAPPIDIDKFVNFSQYCWFGDVDGTAHLPTLTISSPILSYVGDGTTTAFALPSSIVGIASHQETPALYVNSVLTAASMVGNNLVATIAPASGSAVMTTRFDKLSAAMIGANNFPLTGMVNDAITYQGDDSTVSFNISTLSGAAINEVAVFINGAPAAFTYNSQFHTITLTTIIPSAGTATVAPDVVTIVTLRGLFGLLHSTNANVQPGIAFSAIPYLSSGMRINIIDTYSIYGQWDTGGWDIGAWSPTDTVFMVDGVGTSIRLTLDSTMIRGLAAQYQTIDRSSSDTNAWSLRNNWVHLDAIAWSGILFPDRIAVRPIIEFVRDISIWKYGNARVKMIDAVLSNLYCDFNGVPISASLIQGSPINSITVDNNAPLYEGARLLICQSATDSPTWNNVLYTVGAVSGGPGNASLINLIPITTSSLTVAEIGIDSGLGPLGTEVYFDGTVWKLAQPWNESVEPLFNLYDVDAIPTALSDVSRYPGSTFAGSRIFGYAKGVGKLDTVLRRALAYDSNGYIQFENDTVTSRETYAGGNITGLYCYAVNNGSLVVNSLWHPTGNTTSQQTMFAGFQSIPPNLQANPASKDVGIISKSEWTTHLNSLLTNQVGFVGANYAGNTYRDSARDLSLGSAVLQHRAPMLRAMLLASDADFDYFAAVRFADQEYNRFRNKFVRKLVDLYDRGIVQFDSPTQTWVDAALAALKSDKAVNTPFCLSLMGGHFHIPPTPAFLGLLPCCKPGTETDHSFGSAVLMIRGHDGSLTPAYNDWRDIIVVALEQKIYDSIDASLKGEARLHFDLKSWMSGAFYQGSEGYSFVEVRSMIGPIFERWASTGRFDYRTNAIYDPHNPFTWNYRGISDRHGVAMPGNWRAIYQYYFDTDRPHLAPWEMLGFVEMPSWWTAQYGANFGSTNAALWSDLEAGIIRGGVRATGSGTPDPRYVRIGLAAILPVDSAGVLLDPVAARIIPQAPIQQLASRDWMIGDGSPAETLWRYSSSYRFALAQIAFMMKPARLTEILWETLNVGYIGNQWVNLTTYERPSPNGTELIHGETDAESQPVIVVGIQQWIVDNLLYSGKTASLLGNAIRNLDVRLVHKMASFVSTDGIKSVADNFGLIPAEDMQVMLYQSPTIKNDTYSGVIIEWTGSGYRVVGYDARDPVFTIIPPKITGPKGSISLATGPETVTLTWRGNTYYTIGTQVDYKDSVYKCIKSHTSGTQFEFGFWELLASIPARAPRVTTYLQGLNLIGTVPYGTEFATQQEVADFLLAYERWLVSRGWVFDALSIDTNITQDWSLSVRDFLGWSQVQWAVGNFIALSPGAESLKYHADTGTVLNVEDAITGFYGLIDRNGQPISSRSGRISRQDGDLNLTAIDADIFAARVRVIEIEHALVFSNTTIFNDIIYSPLFNIRQSRLRLIGNSSQSWNGRLDAPGYVISGNTLLPSFDKNVEDIRLAFDIEKADSGTLRDYARHQIGYQARDYMEELLLSDTEQFEFYKGMIQAKGSPGAFDRLLRSQRINDDTSIIFLEEWAFRLSRFGAPLEPRATFLLPQNSIRRDPQIIRFATTPNASEDWIEMPLDDAKWLDVPKPVFFPSTNASPSITSAGHVRLSEVQYTAFNVPDLSAYYADAVQAGLSPYQTGERIWIYNNNGDWDVWRIFEAGVGPITISNVVTLTEDPSVNGIRLYFTTPHRFASTDIGNVILIDSSTNSSPELLGLHVILHINTDGSWIEIADSGASGYNFATGQHPRPHVRVMRSIRVSDTTTMNILPFKLPTIFSDSYWQDGDLSFVDSDVINPGRWAVYLHQNGAWVAIRNQPDRIDPKSIVESLVYNVGSRITDTQMISNEPLVNDLIVLDPLLGELPGVAMREIDFSLDYDPALYNAGNATAGSDIWGSNEVGRVWWDTSTVRYLDPYTDTIGVSNARDLAEFEYRTSHWAHIAPNTNVDIYEWTQADVDPSSYAAMALADTSDTYTGTVRAGTPWVERLRYDPKIGRERTVYFYWVQNCTKAPKLPFRKMPISEVAMILAHPTALDLAWIAPIHSDTILVSGIAASLNDSTSALKVELHTTTQDTGHDEWFLMRDGDKRSQPPAWLWKKMRDSLAGFDDNRNLLPSPNLHPTRAIGILTGQSMFATANAVSSRGGLLDARQSFVGIVNKILARTPVSITRSAGVASLNLSNVANRFLISVADIAGEIARPKPYLYDIVVYSIEERNRLLIHGFFNYSARILVDCTKHAIPQWSIWVYNPAKTTALIPHTPNNVLVLDYVLANADKIFDLGTYYDYSVQHLSDRDALLGTNYYAQHILINGAVISFSAADNPSAIYPSEASRNASEGIAAANTLVAVHNGAVWSWSIYDSNYGWIDVAHSYPIIDGTRVYVENNETADGFWSIYQYNPTSIHADSGGYILLDAQDYRTYDFTVGTDSSPLRVVDWYAASYQANKPPMVVYPDIATRDRLEGQSPTNLFVQIKPISGKWFWNAFNPATGWDIVARQGGTIAISNAIYADKTVHGVGNAPSIDNAKNRDGSWEIRVLADVLLTGGLLTDAEINEVFFSMMHFVHSQQDDVDWAFKTSFMNIAGFSTQLLQTPVQVVDVTTSLIAYVNEVKPYRVKIRDYSQQYTVGTETANVHVTDFDNPVYFDAVTGLYRSLDINNAADLIIIQNNLPWSEWYSDFASPTSHARKIKTTMLFDRVSGRAGGYDYSNYGGGIDNLEESIAGTAIDRLTKFYATRNTITGQELNTVLTDSYGLPDLMNLRFKGNTLDGANLAILHDPASDFDASPGGFDTLGFDTQIVTTPVTFTVSGQVPYDVSINGATSDSNRTISDTRTFIDQDGNSHVLPYGGAADPMGYGLRDPYVGADRPEERLVLIADDSIQISVTAKALAGAPEQKTKSFDTSAVTASTGTFFYDEIAMDNTGVFVWRDGLRALLGTDFTVNHFARTVTVNLVVGGQRVNRVVVHAFGSGATRPIIERHLFVGTGLNTYMLDNSAASSQIEVIVNGNQIAASAISASGNTITLAVAPSVGDDVMILIYTGTPADALHVKTQVLAYNSSQRWTINFPDHQSRPEHVGTIVEVDGRRLLPPLTYYAAMDLTRRIVQMDVTPTKNTLTQVYVNGVLYAHDIPIITSGSSSSTYAFGAVALTGSVIIPNTDGFFAYLDDKLVSLDRTFIANEVCVTVFVNNEFDVSNNGTLIITSALTNSSVISVTTFQNAGLLGVRTRTFLAKPLGTYPCLPPVSADYSLVSFDGKVIRPTEDYQFVNNTIAIATDPTLIITNKYVVVTTYAGGAARGEISWRAATTTPASIRMIPIPDDGGFGNVPFGLQPYDQGNDWLVAIPRYNARVDAYGSKQPVVVYQMDDRWAYYRQTAVLAGRLSVPLGATDDSAIILLSEGTLNPIFQSANPLPIPDRLNNKPGVIWIGAELVEYWDLVRVGETITISDLRRGTRGTTVSAENRTMQRFTANGTTTVFSILARGQNLEVMVNGLPMAAIASATNLGFVISNVGGNTTVTFTTAPPAGTFITIGLSAGFIQPAGTIVYDATTPFMPEVPIGPMAGDITKAPINLLTAT